MALGAKCASNNGGYEYILTAVNINDRVTVYKEERHLRNKKNHVEVHGFVWFVALLHRNPDRDRYHTRRIAELKIAASRLHFVTGFACIIINFTPPDLLRRINQLILFPSSILVFFCSTKITTDSSGSDQQLFIVD